MIVDGADYGWKDRPRDRDPRGRWWALAATLGFMLIVLVAA